MMSDSLRWMVSHIGSIVPVGNGASKAALSINPQVDNCLVDGATMGYWHAADHEAAVLAREWSACY